MLAEAVAGVRVRARPTPKLGGAAPSPPLAYALLAKAEANAGAEVPDFVLATVLRGGKPASPTVALFPRVLPLGAGQRRSAGGPSGTRARDHGHSPPKCPGRRWAREPLDSSGRSSYFPHVFFRTRENEKSLRPPVGPGPTREAVLEALKVVQDPDLGRDVVTLGFVQDLTVDGGRVAFRLELTTPACPVKEELKAQSEAAVRTVPGVESVTVTLAARVRKPTAAAGRVALSSVKNVVAVASGKGGVGKSTVAVNLAVALSEAGAKVGLLDADVYGPSVPIMLGTRGERPMSDKENRIYPIERCGVSMISMGHLVPEDKAVVWRGPMVHGALTQLMTQTVWGELDYLVIDMPPGTGDAQLTIAQTAPLAGVVLVTTPQAVSLLDARKALAMFQSVRVPLLGIVENMAGFVCGHCQQVTPIFRQGGGTILAHEAGSEVLASIPIDPSIAEAGDVGTPAVQAQPASPMAEGFRKAARQVAAKLSVLAEAPAAAPGIEWKQ
jgi:ATP-binding protein involved in chromosome partitioning